MRIDRMRCLNYGSFAGPHDLAVGDRGLVFVLGENRDRGAGSSNGAGKSMLFDALDWALFGVVPREDHVDSVVTEGEIECRVEVLLYDEDALAEHAHVKVERRRAVGKKTTLEVQLGKESLTALDIKETQARLEKVLGIDRAMFHACVLFAQGDSWNFANGSDKERLDLLTRILGLGETDAWLATMREQRTAEQVALATCEGAQRHAQECLQSFSGQAQRFEKAIADWDAQEAERVAAAEKTLVDLRARAKDLLAQEIDVGDLERQTSQVEAAAAALTPTLDEQQLLAKCDQATKYAQQYHEAGVGVHARMNEVKGRLARVARLGVGECSECGQPVTGEHIAAESRKLQTQLTALEGELSQHMQNAEGWRVYSSQQRQQLDGHAQTREAEKKRLEAHAADIRAQVVAAQALQRELRTVVALAEKQEGVVSLVKSTSGENPYRVEFAALCTNRDTYQKTINACIEKGGALTERVADLTWWVDALSPQGLRNFVLDSHLAVMNEAANRWVGLLTGNKVWVEFRAQSVTRSGKLSNRLDLVVRMVQEGATVTRNFRSWSGGEKRRVALGVDFGLSRLLAARAVKRYDVLVLDEAFAHLDAEGREAMSQMLAELARERSTVFVVDHDADFAARFANVMRVQKINGRSSIVGIDNERRERSAAA